MAGVGARGNGGAGATGSRPSLVHTTRCLGEGTSGTEALGSSVSQRAVSCPKGRI